jgi:hypothetical protein
MNVVCLFRSYCFFVNSLFSVDQGRAARDTPLHVFVFNSNIHDNTILQLLYDANAHLDCVNALRETPIDIATNSNVKQFLKVRMKLSLKCLCARLINQYDIPFHGKIATSLVKFVEKH